MPSHPVVETLRARASSGPWARKFRVVDGKRLYVVTSPARLMDAQVAEASVAAYNAGFRLYKVVHGDGSSTLYFARYAAPDGIRETTSIRTLGELSLAMQEGA